MNILNTKTLLHGGDYNPDQWLDDKDVLLQDIELMKEAKINFVSLGIFSWSQIEETEGTFTFGWMDDVIKRLSENNISIVLATPSGAKPAWMSQKYPEVCRVNKNGARELFGNRHNHCMSSPVYREKSGIINRELAKRYGNHRAVLLWHISNEYSGFCYCELCIEKFREFLKQKYGTIENINKSWWNTFWSHRFTSFSEINPPMEFGEQSSIALEMDWKRFSAWNTIDFYKTEVKAVRDYSNLPATTNFFGGTWLHLDYFAFAKEVDIVAYDSYPRWHRGDDYQEGIRASLTYDLMRSLKGNKPFLLMESTPSAANWRPASKLKRPKMHELSSIQAVAHGSDMVGYFQLRKGRGGCEKFHSAVIDHDSSNKNRVFKEVKKVGQVLEKISPVLGAETKNEIAVYLDWSNSDAISANKGPRMCGMNYTGDIEAYYCALVSCGYGVDFINFESDLENYTLLILPMVYSAPEKFWQKVSQFVENGGKVVTTYMCGYADENDLIYKTGRNEKLSRIIGAEYHEIDGLEDGDINSTTIFGKTFEVKELCEINTFLDAQIVSVYEKEYYQGTGLISEKDGNYHIAGRIGQKGLKHFFETVLEKMGLEKIIDLKGTKLIVSKRIKDGKEYIFLMNFTQDEITLDLGTAFTDIVTGKKIKNKVLPKYDYAVLMGE